MRAFQSGALWTRVADQSPARQPAQKLGLRLVSCRHG
jgi:hypothetical protein